MLTGQGTIETAVEAMKSGAYDYLTKPYSINELMCACDRRLRSAACGWTTSGCGPKSSERTNFRKL
jgi:DNA-binding NtrC family response regulator